MAGQRGFRLAWGGSAILAPALALILPLMALLLLVETGTVTAMGYEAQQLEARMKEQTKSSQDVETQIGALASLDRVDREAKESLKMALPKESIYLKVGYASPATTAPGRDASQRSGPTNTRQGLQQ